MTGAIRGGRALMPGLSLAFQARFLAVAQPRHARFGAANASERPWRTAKPVPHPKG